MRFKQLAYETDGIGLGILADVGAGRSRQQRHH